jgi:hypothetical protein
MKKKMLFFTVLLLIAISGNAVIITVKSDGTGNYSSIQQAYQASNTNDTILVYPGNYFENLSLTISSKSLVIASVFLFTTNQQDIINTIIDGNASGSVIRVNNTGSAMISIIGFTIRNGSGYGIFKEGGGFNLNNSTVYLRNCVIENNYARAGAGIMVNKSNLNLSGVTIRNNHALLAGGGIFIGQNCFLNFDPVSKCNIYLNHSASGSDLAKVHLSSGQTIILDTCTIVNPDSYFILSTNNWGFPVNDLNISITHGKVNTIIGDLFVDPVNGSDLNSGLNSTDAFKTIAWAYKKVTPDSVNSTSIFLSEGIFSPVTNGELFPIQARSYVNLIGAGMNNTILDADSTTFHFRGTNLTRNYSIRNIGFIKGAIDTIIVVSGYGTMLFNFTENVFLEKIKISHCYSSLGKLTFNHTVNSTIKDVNISDSPGGSIGFGNSYDSIPTTFRMENLAISNNDCFYMGNDGAGGGLSVIGKLSIPGLLKGKITNLQITGNCFDPNPFWGPRTAGALNIANYAFVDVVNSTIGDNVNKGIEGYTVGVLEGGIMNLYNSILYADSLYELVLGHILPESYPVTANISYSNIEGGQENIYNWYNMHTLNWLEGNIDMDPLWLGSGDFPYQLQWNSPCINAGTPMFEEGMQPPYIKLEDDKIVLYKIDGDTLHLPAHDLAGNPRIRGGRIDMGAYEFQDTVNLIRNNPWQQQDNKLHIYPNPFSAHTFISFKTKTPGDILAVVSDMNGRHVKTLMDARTSGGEYSITWKGDDNNGNAVPKGTYIINVSLNGQVKTTGKIVKN